MTEIQEALTLNCRALPASAVPNAPGAPKSNPIRIPIPTSSAAPENTIPSARIVRSRSPGTSAMINAPTAGMNTARVIAQSLIAPPCQILV
jgi:hypothetical protein